ncbi:MAG: hypothetical protein M1825_001142 [Sarcosagium campestre]|nr:MAG: hypothetical protein M1825_001142 [Sarcosagium campestre]
MAQVSQSSLHGSHLGQGHLLPSQTFPQYPGRTSSRAGRHHGREGSQDRDASNSPQSGKESRYQLWPSLSPARSKTTPPVAAESDQIFDSTSDRLAAARHNRSMRNLLGSANKLKPKERPTLGLRKPSAPELGPMTTVQEAPMDSPTIPGRPPLHERSISAPGDWRDDIGRPRASRSPGPTPLSVSVESALESSPLASAPPASQHPAFRHSPPGPLQLVIPSPEREPIQQLRSRSREDIREEDEAEDKPPAPPPKSPRMEGRASPKSKGSLTPATPALSATSIPSGNSVITPGSDRFHSNTWYTPPTAPPAAKSPSKQHQRELSETALGDRGSPSKHLRNPSETSVMERGRPPKRSDTNQLTPAGLKQSVQVPEGLAFRSLPSGIPAVDATVQMASSEIHTLQKQALSQASKFQVLTVNDVESLSRELRSLDERCEYLRTTLISLRSGRRGLHARMVSYLKSPRIAKFSRESLIKQEEALAELDLSIEDWVSKLEHAENRRTRIRYKILEHYTATLTMKTPDDASFLSTGDDSPTRSPDRPSTPVRMERRDVESIKIYADSNVYALLEDVDQEISRMVDLYGGGFDSPEPMEKIFEGSDAAVGILLPTRYQA